MHGEDDVKTPGQHHLQVKEEGSKDTRGWEGPRADALPWSSEGTNATEPLIDSDFWPPGLRQSIPVV